jgi:hypothetical protein
MDGWDRECESLDGGVLVPQRCGLWGSDDSLDVVIAMRSIVPQTFNTGQQLCCRAKHV